MSEIYPALNERIAESFLWGFIFLRRYAGKNLIIRILYLTFVAEYGMIWVLLFGVLNI